CLHIPEGVEVIPWCCFSKCFGIESIELPSSIKELETLAFFDSYMKSVNLPEGLEKIGDEAFLMSDRLLELTVPESCKYIGERAFGSCPSLQKLNLPSSLEKIPAKMLQGSWAIEKFDFPSSLKEIGEEAFSYCQALTEVILPEGLEYIGINAFRDCYSIENAYFPSTLKSIQAGAAAGWENAKRISCAASIPPIALCDNVYPELTPFGYYDAIKGQYATPRETPLYVPKGSAESYRQMAGWDYFTNIKESEDFAGVVEIPECQTQGIGTDGIYDLTGRHINSPTPGQICIKEGRKVIIRK
ncbi:MAG: leucine-rich repeat domain-containing protein, partial [Muribaculaceae bacterium]|nr:leucine-rich repeat domain-containing protein [Muribaculaceae bacterium]